MKWMIASDLHGSVYGCERMIAAFDRERADRLVLLGDLLYHGPRNALPRDYETGAVAALLNARRESILCVRGNCDAEVDQMILDFPIMSDYAFLADGEATVFATHGHHYSESNPPPLHKGDVLLQGHTHIPRCALHGDFIAMNPGSVSLPKGGSWAGYMTMENGVFLWKELDGTQRLRYPENA